MSTNNGLEKTMAERREFLTLAGASLLATGVVASAARAQETGEAASVRANAPIPNATPDWRLQHRFGLGGVAIGNGMNVNTDEDAYAALDAAWNAGVRYFDTASFYGCGLSERRFGYYLYNKPREDYVVLSKVGRNFYPDATVAQNWNHPIWRSPPNFRYEYDFSAAGVRRSVEQILQRMNLPYLDIALVHDLDAFNNEIDWQERFEECKRGAFPELARMRDEGLIRGWGLGVNSVDPILRCMEEADPDIHLSAEQYSLINHSDAVERLLPAVEEHGNQLILGGVLNTGFLAGSPRYHYQEANVTPERLQAREAARAIAQNYGVDLRTAAIQFSLAPSQVTSVAVGARNEQQVDENIASLAIEIPEGFWSDLKQANIVHPDAQTSYTRVTL